jgi:hypothetical protein
MKKILLGMLAGAALVPAIAAAQAYGSSFSITGWGPTATQAWQSVMNQAAAACRDGRPAGIQSFTYSYVGVGVTVQAVAKCGGYGLEPTLPGIGIQP